ncbi:MAG: hypothetical protein COB50_00895 [Thiotrichales bacterium]|nr:MAG: hypothetical protein COB50_00895 [Thiotrichales bacterium]
MGGGSFSVTKYAKQAEIAKVSVNSGFKANSMCGEFDPRAVSTRFSKTGPFNEFKDVITILVGLDVTGSMGKIPKNLVTGKLGSLMVDLQKTFNRPNENLQISFAGIGDAKTDRSPLQVTHFESDNRFAQQLPKIWLEGRGGANGAESYNLLWYYAANKTHLNYVEQAKRKGILITVGDDNVHPSLTASEIKRCLDPKYDGGNLSNEVLLNAVREQYDVYHIVVTDGTAYGYDFPKRANKSHKQKKAEAAQWVKLLGPENVIPVRSKNVASAIATIIKKHRPVQKVNMSQSVDENKSDATHLTKEEWKVQNMKSLTDSQWKEALSYTLCPLTREFMKHPVVWGGSKEAYEKEAVKKYILLHQKDPRTQKKVSANLLLKPNLSISQLCLHYKPYFELLSQERQKKLVDLTLPVEASVMHKMAVENKELEHKKTVNISQNAHVFLSKIEKANDAINLKLECPISMEIMERPVILIETGQTYDEASLKQWFEKNNTDPLTNKVLNSKQYIHNVAMQSLCDTARVTPELNN